MRWSPPLRRVYVKLPWPHLYELPQSGLLIVVEGPRRDLRHRLAQRAAGVLRQGEDMRKGRGAWRVPGGVEGRLN
jgi:hypothetical protein